MGKNKKQKPFGEFTEGLLLFIMHYTFCFSELILVEQPATV